MPVGTELFVALDARAVSAAAVAGGLRGRRLRGFVRVPLSPGALVPSPGAQNLHRTDEVREAVRRATASLGVSGPVTLVLPDGLARLALVEGQGGNGARELVRFRLGSSLPWPASEAIVDALPAGRGRVAGAAVRRDLVAGYEEVVRSAGLSPRAVRLAPLLVVRAAMRSTAAAVHLALSDTASCLVATRNGVSALRSRRRDSSAGEAARLLAEAERTARMGGHDGGGLALVLWGSDARLLREEMAEASVEVLAPVSRGPDADEVPWLEGALA